MAVAQAKAVGLEIILSYLGGIRNLLTAEDVDEVQINAGGARVFTERKGVTHLEPVKLDSDSLYGSLKRIAIVAGQEINDDTWRLDCRFVGCRLSAVFPPVSPNGICVTIRKFISARIEDLVANNTLSVSLAAVLRDEILERQNILVSGATGSGKTVLASTLANVIPDRERILLIEQPSEMELRRQPNVVYFEALDPGPGGRTVTQWALLKQALRAHPSRLIIGEIRGEEAGELLALMNTGHSGTISTTHANSARGALERFASLCQKADQDWPWEALRKQIAGNVNIVLHLRQREDGTRYVSEVLRVEDYNAAGDLFMTSTLPGGK